MSNIILKLVIAALVGGLIGSERELRVGFGLRTLMLICLGATMFTIYSSYFAFGEGDPRRIAAAVVSGVGFLGAGMILRNEGSILGLTTAAASWLVAALGMGIGLGYYQIVAVATILVVIILWAVSRLKQLTQSPKPSLTRLPLTWMKKPLTNYGMSLRRMTWWSRQDTLKRWASGSHILCESPENRTSTRRRCRLLSRIRKCKSFESSRVIREISTILLP